MKNQLNITVDDIKPHIIGITESWAKNDITDEETSVKRLSERLDAYKQNMWRVYKRKGKA